MALPVILIFTWQLEKSKTTGEKMSNGYEGSIKIDLFDITYEMKVDIGAITEFQSETGNDFFSVSARAINAYYKSRSSDSFFERSEIMTKAVSMSDAATFFWICAKRVNSNVEFGEFQEACWMEGERENNDGIVSYPVKFVQLCQFATHGVIDAEKKKRLAELKKPTSKRSSTKK